MSWLRNLLPFRRSKRGSRSRQGPSHPTQAASKAPLSLSPPKPQLDSPFFTVLPPEIRLQIYSYFIPQIRTFHIIPQRGTTHRLPQPAGNVGFVEYHDMGWHTDGLWMTLNGYPPWAWPCGRATLIGGLAICRRMDDEVLNLLYSTKTFYIDAPTSLLLLRESTPHKYFNQITSLRLMFCSTYASPKSPINVVRWNEALSALQQLSNLQSLQILLSEHCWDDFFDQRSKKYEDFNASQAERLLYHTSTPWYRDPEVERGIEQILPYLEWVKSIRCKGEVIIQMFEKAEVAGGTCVYVLGEELKLRDGLLVGH